MQLVTNSNFRLSKNGGATNIILVAHGGWSKGDGKVYVPNGMVIHFYAYHGQFNTQAVPRAENLLGAANNDPAIDFSRIINESMEKKWTPEQIDEAMLQAKASVNSKGGGDLMHIEESVRGRGLGSRQKVYNYVLAYRGPRDALTQPTENLFAQHQQGALNSQFDLMIMQPDATSLLSEAIGFARSHGEKYTVFHYLPCRWVDNTDVKSMRTVNIPMTLAGRDMSNENTLPDVSLL